jgi:amino acid transporter
MDRKGKYFNAIYIGSGLITAAGVLLVLAKIYGYIGLILLFFGGLIFLQALGIVMLAAAIARAAGEYYYEKIHKNLGS